MVWPTFGSRMTEEQNTHIHSHFNRAHRLSNKKIRLAENIILKGHEPAKGHRVGYIKLSVPSSFYTVQAPGPNAS